jgi:tripartite-type tricarboxylate transporter receptor subunit TctC
VRAGGDHRDQSAVAAGCSTVGEFVPGYEVSVWFSISAPKSTPPEIIATLNREINAGLADPKLAARLVELGGAPCR